MEASTPSEYERWARLAVKTKYTREVAQGLVLQEDARDLTEEFLFGYDRTGRIEARRLAAQMKRKIGV